MRINELTRKCVTFLGILDQTGAFAPYGTGFIGLWLENGLGFFYLVTARHVIDDMEKSGRPLVCRLNTRGGHAQLGLIPASDLRSHPSDLRCDIAVANLAVSPATFDIGEADLNNNCLMEDYIVKHDVGCGDEVFTCGLLVNQFGSTRNVPVVRIGNIASMPDEPVNLGSHLGSQKVYLIESRSIGGLSGSPVFLNTPPFRMTGNRIVDSSGHHRQYLLGVNIGLFPLQSPSGK